MKKFKFRLQKVLEYRELLKRESERELGMKHNELRDAEQGVEDIISAQEACQPPLSDKAISMAELALTGDYQLRLQEELINQRLLVIQAIEAVETARDQYIEKAMEAKILDKLKDRRLTEHKREMRKEERKVVDELVIHRHGSNKKTSDSENE
jgi:flagellar FliJ protein